MLPFAPWLSWVVPLVGSLFVPAVFRTGKRAGEVYSVAVAFIAAAFSLSMIPDVYGKHHGEVIKVPWIPLGEGRYIEASLLVDPLSVLMASIATGIGALIVLYSVGYMAHEEGLPRYYFFMLFFIGGMTLLVMSENLLMLYIGWEIVGLCSYALIGFYNKKPEANAAGIKAFVTTRIGDASMLVGIVILFGLFGTFSFTGLEKAMAEGIAKGTVSTGLLILPLLLLFGGAVGKSAQFPLHVWLPDAMEGPTPVSALIHAATMVKAGVYLVARLIFTVVPFEAFPPALLADWYLTVAMIAGFTAFFSATMGLVSSDIKRVIAYSTISQLGLMLAALGMASEIGWFAGTFHLLSHSIFKALLFLAAGAVIHAVHTNNLDEMGGLRNKMPITFWTSTIGILSLSGVPLLSGFWSKDLVIESSLQSQNIAVFLFIAGASVLTVAYSLRWLYKVFLAPSHNHHDHVHEAPKVMTIPLIILASLSVVIGVTGPIFEEQLHEYLGVHGKFSVSLTTYATTAFVLAAGGGLAYLFYFGKVKNPAEIRQAGVGATLHRIIANRYYIDAFYYRVFVDGIDKIGSAVHKFVELKVIDGFNYFLSRVTVSFVQVFRNIQTGQSNINISGLIIGLAIFLLLLLRFVFGIS
ncbi:MAG: NADH-quinone oxidoreductase subunit L [Candidatus Caldarchaeum sp.]|nr:NADH-quinone oxidoreductase subunit L [Candidatus Caldarchaeum sp.]